MLIAPRMWSSMTGLLAGSRATLHIIRYITAPAMAPSRMAMPKVSVTPMNSRPSMNAQLTQASPAMLL